MKVNERVDQGLVITAHETWRRALVQGIRVGGSGHSQSQTSLSICLALRMPAMITSWSLRALSSFSWMTYLARIEELHRIISHVQWILYDYSLSKMYGSSNQLRCNGNPHLEWEGSVWSCSFHVDEDCYVSEEWPQLHVEAHWPSLLSWLWSCQ